MSKPSDPRQEEAPVTQVPSALPPRPTLTPLSAPRRKGAPQRMHTGLWETPEGFGVTVLK